MANKIIKGFISNGLANVVQKLIKIADQLLLVPFFLTQWGPAYYGEWLTLSIIPSVLAYSDLGFGSAVSNSFVLSYASGDKQRAANLRKTGFWIISSSVALGCILTFLVMVFADCFGLFGKTLIPAEDATLAVLFMITAQLIGFYHQLIEGFYRSVRRAALGSLIGSGSSLLKIVIGFCILMAGYGVVGYAFTLLVVSILFLICYSILGCKMIDLNGYQGKVLMSDIKDITKKGMGYLMTPVWQSVFFQGTTFAVRIALGAEAVAIFNTVRTVCRSVNQVFSIINASIFPDLQYEYGKGNIKLVQKYFRVAVLMSMLIGFAGTFVLILVGLDIYRWWTDNLLEVPMAVWNVFMIGVFVNAVWWTSVVTYRMTNQPYHFAIASTITAFVSVGITCVLSKSYGIIGAAIGCTAFEVIMAIYVLPDSCKLIGMRVGDLFSNVRMDALAMINKFKKIKR